MNSDTEASAIARDLEAARMATTETIVYKGRSVPVIVENVQPTGPSDFVPDGSRNASAALPTIFSAQVSDFHGALPSEKDTLTYQAVSYTVTEAYTTHYGATRRITAYRTPAVATSTNDAAQRAKWPAPPP